MGNATDKTAPQPLSQSQSQSPPRPSPSPERISIPSNADLIQMTQTLQAHGVPLIITSKSFNTTTDSDDRDDGCAGCEIPCDLGSFPTKLKLDIDLTSQLNGTTKPYFRQVIISTGVSNWAHEVTETEGSLAYFLNEVHTSLSKKTKEDKSPRGPDVPKFPEDQLSAAVAAVQLESTSISTSATSVTPPPRSGKDSEQKEKKEEKKDTFPAILDTSQSQRLIINNGSFKSASDNDDCLTAIVLPDFTYVNEIKETKENAEQLWRTTLDPNVGRGGRKLPVPGTESASRNKFQTRPLPYDSVVLICSHKRRDNRCGIAAPILEKAITVVLESRGWEVHGEIEIDDSIQSLEDRFGDDNNTRGTELLRQIRDSEGHHNGHGASKRALLVKVSHIGGHKFAGNIIVYSPSGTGVWYGRVSPEKVPAVVDETIIGGKVIPELLRAMVNVSPGRRESFYEW